MMMYGPLVSKATQCISTLSHASRASSADNKKGEIYAQHLLMDLEKKYNNKKLICLTFSFREYFGLCFNFL